MTDDEEFYAWLDGQLDREAAERVAARVAASPELTAKAEEHRAMTAGLRKAFQPVIDAPVEPPSFQSSAVIDFRTRRNGSKPDRGWFTAPQWAAMAASLAIGLVAGTQISGGGSAVSPVAIRDGTLVAAAELDDALDARLASAPSADGSRMGLTFRDRAGHVCRSFSNRAASGLACREGDDWRLLGLFPAGEGQAGDYRMAAGGDPRLAALIDETISGEPFDAAQEKAALDANWR